MTGNREVTSGGIPITAENRQHYRPMPNGWQPKVAYASRARAERQAKIQHKEAYRCKVCRAWHIGGAVPAKPEPSAGPPPVVLRYRSPLAPPPPEPVVDLREQERAARLAEAERIAAENRLWAARRAAATVRAAEEHLRREQAAHAARGLPTVPCSGAGHVFLDEDGLDAACTRCEAPRGENSRRAYRQRFPDAKGVPPRWATVSGQTPGQSKREFWRATQSRWLDDGGALGAWDDER